MKFLCVLFLLLPLFGYSQTVSVSNLPDSATNLAGFLFDSGCVELSNASFSSSESVAKFNNNGGDFPISEGIIIRSGKAEFSEGPYTGNNLSSQLNSLGDPNLQIINDASGQASSIMDVAYLQFDFIPLSNKLSFDFLFASNEYGQWQCVSSDAFAFFLTNLNTGQTTNLALIPNTALPVSVRNIRDNAHNPSCTSQNLDLFDVYTVDDPENSTLNMRGYTSVMNASSTIVPGTPYQIRLVVGDSNDADFDSAIFLDAGSFGTSVDLGEDQNLCDGDTMVLETDLDPNDFTFVWKRNGEVIPNENAPVLTVSQTGTYEVVVTKNGSNCTFSDTVAFDDLMVQPPEDISTCNNGSETYTYDLTQNDAEALGLDPATYQVFYYASESDAQDNLPIPDNQLTEYISAGNETVHIKIFNTSTGNFCNAHYTFQLLINSEINISPPVPIDLCFDPAGYIIDLSQTNDQILNGQTADDFTISFYPGQASAENGENAILTPNAYPLASGFSTKTLWARVDAQDSDCFSTVDFDIIEHPLPPVSELQYTIVCSGYILPNIDMGGYYSESNGQGTHFDPGDTLIDTGEYFIFNGPNENGCTNETSFYVFVVEDYNLTDTYCDYFLVPDPPVGNIYTAIDGPNGTGSIIPPGTILTTDQTIYYYAEVNGELCRNEAFDIDIAPLPLIDEPSDVVSCQSYTLPPLQNGSYFTDDFGSGILLSAGDVINTSQTIYIYADDGTCTNQSSFDVMVISGFTDVTACGSYTLPELAVGGYFTQALGQGEEIQPGTEITTSQTVYFYAENAEIINCGNIFSFQVTINPIPTVDTLDNVVRCQDAPYALPVLQNGSYFTQSDRNGEQLYAGDVISSTQDIYINAMENGCSHETSFTVTINPLPPIVNFSDIYSCTPYPIPEPADGKIYTEPNGGGNLLMPGQLITSTQTLYIYNQSDMPPYCENQQEFTVYIYDLDVGIFEDVKACDSYVLPPLAEGNYFTETDGKGQELFSGHVIDSSQTLYVYEKQGDRFICESEASFDITISETPQLPYFEDIERCGSYTLPTLSTSDYDVGYYFDPDGETKIDEVSYTFDQPGTYTIYVYATAFDNKNCYDERDFQLTINPLRELQIPDANICVDVDTGETLTPAYIDSGLDPSAFQVDWFLNGNLVHTGSDYEIETSGAYTIKTTKLTPNDGNQCNYEPETIIVRKSSSPLAKAYVSKDFSEIASIRIQILKGVGDYVFQLDDGPFQPGQVFHDVKSGFHTITIKDVLNACGEEVLEVQVVKHPKFFTPNNDGKNDRWNIKDLADHPEAEIFIYDRYGKFLKKIHPNSAGWDGTYNGRAEVSADYWFKVVYRAKGQARQFVSHFTLKR